MKEKILRLDMLTNDSVTVVKVNVVTVNNVEYQVGNEIYTAYINSTNGRTQVQAEVSEPYLTSIMSMWGDNATVIEESSPSNAS